MANVPTDVRAAVRVLLRGEPMPTESSRTRRIAGYTLLIIGEASASSWPGLEVMAGDLEGVVWTTPRQARSVIENLRKSPSVIDARGSSTDE